jgi:NAD(P)-dependent dehydrogenase (short-subunit alcohol dehydrogenase family)
MGGASDDHGRASSSFLASHGARVGVIDKDAEKLKLLITELKAAGHVAEGFEDVNKVVQAFSMVAVDFVVVFGCDDFKARLPLQLLAEGARVVLVTSSVVELDPDWAKVKLIVVKTGKGDLCPLLEFLASNAANGIVSGTVIALE